MKSAKEPFKYQKRASEDALYKAIVDHYGKDSAVAISILAGLEKDQRDEQDWSFKSIDFDQDPFSANATEGFSEATPIASFNEGDESESVDSFISYVAAVAETGFLIRRYNSRLYMLMGMDVWRSIRDGLKSESEKDLLIWNLHRYGYSSKQIGERFKITRQAIDKRLRRLRGKVCEIIKSTVNDPIFQKKHSNLRPLVRDILKEDTDSRKAKISDKEFMESFKRVYVTNESENMSGRNQGVSHYVGFPDITQDGDYKMPITNLDELLDSIDYFVICADCGFRAEECKCDTEKDTASTLS